MLVGSIGYIISLSSVAWAFTPTEVAPSCWSDSCCHRLARFGQGAVIWVFISEIFPTRVRAKWQALGCFTQGFMCALIAWTFPMFAEKTGAHVFAFYAGMMVLQLIWVITMLPETKGIPLEEIQRKLGIE